MNNKFFKTVQNEYKTHKQLFRKITVGSNDALSNSKRAIFAFHRGDLVAGKKLLDEAVRIFNSFESEFKKDESLRYAGVYRAALEEFVEAHLLFQFLSKKPLGESVKIKDIDAEVFLGGLSDLTGELVRYAIAEATDGETKEVKRASQTLDEVMAFLIELDLTGPLRSKYDQAKNSLRKMEGIVYDVSMKTRLK